MKPIEKMNFVELKNEAKKRGVFDTKASTSSMKNAVQKHRDDNPDFNLADKVVEPTKTNTKEQATQEDKSSSTSENAEIKSDEPKKEIETKTEKTMKTKKVKAPKKAKAKKAASKKAVAKKPIAQKKASAKKQTPVKKEKAKESPIDLASLKSKHKKILDADYKKKYKIVALYNAGVNKKEIEALLGTNKGWIWNELNSYKTEKKHFDKVISGGK